MTKRARISVIVFAGVLLVICVALLPAFIKARSTSAFIPCVANLIAIDRAETQWAVDKGKTNGTVPTWDDIRPYLQGHWTNGVPICPDGGTYTLEPVGESPRCSLGDKDKKEYFRHSIP
jgi:hypothetical protein